MFINNGPDLNSYIPPITYSEATCNTVQLQMTKSFNRIIGIN